MSKITGSVVHFAKFDVTSQVFWRTKYSFAVVNLKPLLPGHILVCPLQVKPRLSDLTSDELTDLFATVSRIQKTLTRLYKADAFNIAVQDGKAAGQSVPHVHCHVIPRKDKDAGGDDKVHQWLEGEEGDIGKHQQESRQQRTSEWKSDDERKPRSKEEMEAEARWLKEELEKDQENVKL